MANTYLTRSIPSDATSTPNKMTLSLWLKGGQLSSTQQTFFSIWNTGSANLFWSVYFSSNGSIYLYWKDTTEVCTLGTTQKFKDVNSWYHLVWEMDTTLATAADRVKMYINGERVTAFEDSLGTISQNKSMDMMENSNGRITIGRGATGGSDFYWNGSLTHIAYTDGYAYPASTFGETDSASGVWKPKTSPSVTWGTNGFFLKFENSGNMGLDSSGQSHNFTVGGGTLTQNIDTPTNVYPTFNVLAPGCDNRTHTNGNLHTGGNSNNAWSSHPATLAVSSGKWYWEIKDETDWGSTSDSTRRYGIVNLIDGITQARASATDVRYSDNAYAYAYMNASGVRTGGSTIGGSTGTHPTYAEGDYIQVAMDLDHLKLYFGKNGTWLDSGNPASGASGTGAVATLAAGGTWAPYVEIKYGSDTATANFGQGYFKTTAAGSNADANGHGKFKYSVPSGYYAICTKNIKEFG